MSKTQTETTAITEKEAREILAKVELEKSEKLKEVSESINEIINENNMSIGAVLNKETWLKLGERFLNGENQIILQPNINFRN
jgi:hypothetical protein